MATVRENSAILGAQREHLASGTETGTECDRRLTVIRVLEAIQKSIDYVMKTTSPHTNKKRKRTEDDGSNDNAKKCKTSFKNCSEDGNIEGDTDCSICLEPWSVSGDHRVVSLKCGHLLGLSCAVKWIDRSHKCPYCCSPAEISDLRHIFAQKIKAEDTSQRDHVIKLLEKEKAAKADLKKQLAKLKADNEAMRRELNWLKRQAPSNEGYSPTGFGITATLTAFKNCLSKHISDVLKPRYKVNRPYYSVFEFRPEGRRKLPDQDNDGGDVGQIDSGETYHRNE